MSTEHMNDQSYRRDLGDGLVLRWSSAADIEGIAQLYETVFREKVENPLNWRMRRWAEDVASGRHPAASANDFAVVEDTRSNLIVSALMVLRQTWSYDGILFEIGRPEAVATHPDYRNRGAVRGIFDLLHARSAARGQLVQGITGISYFYRQFGYEYAVDLGGSRIVPFSSIPKLKEGEQELYSLRPVTLEDLPLIKVLYEREQQGLPGNVPLVTSAFDERWWRWMLDGQNPDSGQGANTQIIIDGEGRGLGYVMPARLRWGETQAIFALSTSEGAPLFNMVPSVLRGLEKLARETQPWREGPEQPARLEFMLGDSHPFYDALNANYVSRSHASYAWYVRVPDLPAFVRHIAPVLEERLAHSPASGYTGELKLDFYRGGLRLAFEQGKLTAVEDWRRPIWSPGTSAGFPPLVFLQLLFCRRSLDDLRYAYPDVWAEDDPAVVLRALFPKRRSWALGQD